MQPVSSKSRSAGYTSTSSQGGSFEPTCGWETQVSELARDKSWLKEIISTANSKIPLSYAFSKHNVSLEETYSSTGWAYNCCCPFDDHNDRTPSFGFNPALNIFKCFGCSRQGGIVDFLSIKEGRDKKQVALELLQAYGISDVVINNKFDFNRFKNILFDHANTILAFKRKHNFSTKATEYAAALTWSLDVFLRKNTVVPEINLDNLEARIEKIQEQLNLFEDV